MHDTEDKNWWCLHGANLEKKFVDFGRNRLGLNVKLNPEKETNPYVPDLLYNEKLADLKTQNTPFFTAKRYGFDPRYTVTFNRKDYERYKRLYPELIILFWVSWEQTQWKDMKVDYFGGVFGVRFSNLADQIETSKVPEHSYIHRKMDKGGNAKSSFLLDLRNFYTFIEFDNYKQNQSKQS